MIERRMPSFWRNGKIDTSAVKVQPMEILTGPIDYGRWSQVRAVDAELALLEVLAACDDATMARYHAMRETLEADGCTLEQPGKYAKRVEATMNGGDQLAKLLKAERRYLAACDAAERFTPANKPLDKSA